MTPPIESSVAEHGIAKDLRTRKPTPATLIPTVQGRFTDQRNIGFGGYRFYGPQGPGKYKNDINHEPPPSAAQNKLPVRAFPAGKTDRAELIDEQPVDQAIAAPGAPTAAPIAENLKKVCAVHCRHPCRSCGARRSQTASRPRPAARSRRSRWKKASSKTRSPRALPATMRDQHEVGGEVDKAGIAAIPIFQPRQFLG